MNTPFAVFAFPDYDRIREGGWDDFRGTFQTLEQALEHVANLGGCIADYWQIVDLRENKIVKRGKRQ